MNKTIEDTYILAFNDHLIELSDEMVKWRKGVDKRAHLSGFWSLL